MRFRLSTGPYPVGMWTLTSIQHVLSTQFTKPCTYVYGIRMQISVNGEYTAHACAYCNKCGCNTYLIEPRVPIFCLWSVFLKCTLMLACDENELMMNIILSLGTLTTFVLIFFVAAVANYLSVSTQLKHLCSLAKTNNREVGAGGRGEGGGGALAPHYFPVYWYGH